MSSTTCIIGKRASACQEAAHGAIEQSCLSGRFCYNLFMELPRRRLGKTGVHVSVLGLGGEGILRTHGFEREARLVIETALDLGVTYMESARAYAGSEAYYGTALNEKRRAVFLASKSHARDKKGALAHLEETLRNMRTDYLDLWQVHDVRSNDEVEQIFGPGGAMEGFIEARRKGLVRFIGVTGHHDPFILRKCIEEFDFDTVLLPVNAAEPSHRSFLAEVLPEARARDMGIIGMKVYLGGLARHVPGHPSPEPFLRFALSQPVSTVVIGCRGSREVLENARIAQSFQQMSTEEMDILTHDISPFARELMRYKGV